MLTYWVSGTLQAAVFPVSTIKSADSLRTVQPDEIVVTALRVPESVLESPFLHSRAYRTRENTGDSYNIRCRRGSTREVVDVRTTWKDR